MSQNRRIRPAREEDVPRLIEVARRSWLSAFAQSAPFAMIAYWVRADRESSWYPRYWPDMLVLEDDVVISGLVQPMEAEINGLWVHPDWQGTGAGTLLLRAGEEVIRQAGHPAAWLTCSAFNPKAFEFYRRRGYIETGRDRVLHTGGFLYEDIRMERPLER